MPGNNGASLATARLLRKGKEGMQARLGITGLTGPGEHWFNTSVGVGIAPDGSGVGEEGRLNARGNYSDVDEELEGDVGEGEENEEEYARRSKYRDFPSVFSELKEPEEGDEEEEQDQDAEERSEDLDPAYRDRKAKFGWDINNYKDPSELDTSTTAAAVVQAWAFKLKGTVQLLIELYKF